MANVAFIGLGVMGLPMAGHLLAAGHSLRVHTRRKSKITKLLSRGGVRWAQSPAEAATGSEVVFICVPDTPDVEQVIVGPQGVIETAAAGTIVVDHSTISPSATRELATRLEKNGVWLVDAPVSGGDVGARDATLSIMCGGDRGAFDKVEALLRHMGKEVTYCGVSGAGQSTKLVNQILVSVTTLAVSEALIFAKKNGLNLDTTMRAVGGGAGSSWQLQRLGPKMIAADNRPGFTVDLQQKDLRLVLDASDGSNTSLPATSLVHQLFTAAQAAGHGKDGTQALFTVLEKLASTH
jgi:3-hydroxyisobutyrate dehydrogenase